MDDILIAARNKIHIQNLRAQLKEFDMKYLVQAKKILGIENSRDKSTDKLWLF